MAAPSVMIENVPHVVVDAMPAGGAGLTDLELRASPIPVEATIDTTGLATSGGQTAGNASLASIDGKLANPLPVTGAFFQATQPVSLASVPSHAVTGPVTDAQLRASAVPVSLASVPSHAVTGTFWQATQPVSGTFWQATQPVSLATAPTTPVTGTFWQATQPVSGTVSQAKTALTPSAPAAASVGVASAQAVATNANRKGLILVNTSANQVSLGLGATAVLGSGITLSANGGAWSMDEYSFTTGAINAIAGWASSNLAVQEFTT